MKKLCNFPMICVIVALVCFSCKKEKACDPKPRGTYKDSITLEFQDHVNLRFVDDTVKMVTLELWIQISTLNEGIYIDSLTSDSSFNKWAYIEVNDEFNPTIYDDDSKELLFDSNFQLRTTSQGRVCYYLAPYTSARLTVRATVFTDGSGTLWLHGNTFSYGMNVGSVTKPFSKDMDAFVTMGVDI